MSWGEVRAARASHEASLFGRANVVGVAVGQKVIRGQGTDEPCVVVYVERKRPEGELRRRDVVPKVLAGVRTDVVETGRFVARELLSPTAVDRTERIRPAPGGVSIAHHRVTAGTLGVVAIQDGLPVILSNNHVLANENDARPGDAILQPGPADGGRPDDEIARLEDFVPIIFNQRNLGAFGRFVERLLGPLLALLGLQLKRLPEGRANIVDAAIAAPVAEDLVDPQILDIGSVGGTAEAEVGMDVRKSGRTTGLTSGRITGLDAVVEVDYQSRTAVFRRQIVSDLLSRGGDSGSLVVDDRNRAVGLLFAGGATTTLLNPIGDVLRALKLILR
jgi:hypothetical protein